MLDLDNELDAITTIARRFLGSIPAEERERMLRENHQRATQDLFRFFDWASTAPSPGDATNRTPHATAYLTNYLGRVVLEALLRDLADEADAAKAAVGAAS